MCSTWGTWAQTTVQRRKAGLWHQKQPGTDAAGGRLQGFTPTGVGTAGRIVANGPGPV
jgi:hypothetical protein